MIAAAGADSTAASAASPIANGPGPWACPRRIWPRWRDCDFTAFDERRWAAFAGRRPTPATTSETSRPTWTANFRHHFDAQERADIELAARTMYWLNETSNSVDAFLARLRRDPYPGSTAWSPSWWRSCVYAVIVPILLTWLSVKQRRNPISMFRGMRPFFREFEARGPHTISGPGVRYRGPRPRDAVSPG